MFNMMPYQRRRRELAEFNPFHEMDEMEKRFFGGNFLSEFKTDIKDNGKEYLLEADLPGFKKEDINLDIEGNDLVISAQRHSEYEEKDKQGKFLSCERSYGSFKRSFDISGVKQDAIKASYENGVLKLVLPKQEETKPSSRKLEIE